MSSRSNLFSPFKMVIIDEESNTEEIKSTKKKNPSSNPKSQQESSSEDDSFEDALTQDQLNERTLNQANEAKVKGNRLFGERNYDALLKYELALEIASDVNSSEEIRAVSHGNRAACFLKLCEGAKNLTKVYILISCTQKRMVRLVSMCCFNLDSKQHCFIMDANGWELQHLISGYGCLIYP